MIYQANDKYHTFLHIKHMERTIKNKEINIIWEEEDDKVKWKIKNKRIFYSARLNIHLDVLKGTREKNQQQFDELFNTNKTSELTSQRMTLIVNNENDCVIYNINTDINNLINVFKRCTIPRSITKYNSALPVSISSITNLIDANIIAIVLICEKQIVCITEKFIINTRVNGARSGYYQKFPLAMIIEENLQESLNYLLERCYKTLFIPMSTSFKIIDNTKQSMFNLCVITNFMKKNNDYTILSHNSINLLNIEESDAKYLEHLVLPHIDKLYINSRELTNSEDTKYITKFLSNNPQIYSVFLQHYNHHDSFLNNLHITTLSIDSIYDNDLVELLQNNRILEEIRVDKVIGNTVTIKRISSNFKCLLAPKIVFKDLETIINSHLMDIRISYDIDHQELMILIQKYHCNIRLALIITYCLLTYHDPDFKRYVSNTFNQCRTLEYTLSPTDTLLNKKFDLCSC